MHTTHTDGFTLFEPLVAITVGVALLSLALSIYILSLRSLNTSQNQRELANNARTVIDRITRDVRQARGIANILPPGKDDPENPPVSEIELEDGNVSSYIQYIHYYLSGTNLKRQVRQYHFADEPGIYVTFDAEDDFGNQPEVVISDDTTVGQYIDSLLLYGNNVLTIELALSKNSITHSTRTSIYVRNL